jgi:hypothetical protein
MVAESPYTRDAVGQFVRIGELVADVKTGRYPVTVAGQMVNFDSRSISIRVELITDTGDHARRSNPYANLGRPKIGDVTKVWRERTFKVDAIFTREENDGND